MQEEIKTLVRQYYRKELTKELFQQKVREKIGFQKTDFKQFFLQILQSKNAGDLEFGLVILYALEENNDMLDLLHQTLLEPWHREYEALAHELQRRKRPESIPFLKEAMQQKFPYPESYGTGTGQFINQCGHALWSIGTKEALDVIRELSQSDDPVLKDQMLYRLSRIEGRDDYERKF